MDCVKVAGLDIGEKSVSIPAGTHVIHVGVTMVFARFVYLDTGERNATKVVTPHVNVATKTMEHAYLALTKKKQVINFKVLIITL